MPAPRTEMWNKMKRLFVLSIMSFILVIFSDTVCTWIIPEEKQSEGRVRFGGGDFTSFIISYYPILGTPPPPPCCGFLVKVRPCPFIPKCRQFQKNQWEPNMKSRPQKWPLWGANNLYSYHLPASPNIIIILLSTISFSAACAIISWMVNFLTLLLRATQYVFFFLYALNIGWLLHCKQCVFH